ncbi:BAR domain [Macleaya cordata]|uniref:BAR domain n=1 Tax=Macleaya cordata TaxID=56857 RepID=A0A200QGJ3_MACCD|nr:BAR domain [Macleaya cordata]
MKSSLKKLRGFALHHRHDAKDKRDLLHPSAQLDELAQASQDMHDMRNCYDSLLSAAAATANSAYEFSESLREMGTCLLEKTALNDDEESGKVLIMLGKVQFELQKLVDSYRSHIFQTITTPSESLLNELRTVEEMKRQCDEKRNVYEYMMAAQREKGKSRTSKGETFSSQQLQTAHDEYDEEATLFVFRLKSLKQGQTRSLLTQAARHHAAQQLNFFSKGLRSLEAVDPHVRSVTEHQHIDYQFSGLEDDDGEDGYDDDGHGYDANDDGELSFDYGQNDHRLDISTSRNSMELDQVDLSFPQVSTAEPAQENLDRSYPDLHTFNREPKTGSHSAPIFAEKRFDAAERVRQLRPSSSRKFHTYVLPTPLDAKTSQSAGSSNPAPRTSLSGTHNLWHSSPLEPKKHEKDSRDDKVWGLNNLKPQSVLKESNINSASNRLPPPLAEGFSLPQLDPRTADTKKIKRYAYSGPITSKAWSAKPSLSSSGPIGSMEHPQLVPGLSRVPVHPSSSPKVSPSASPPLISSPKISELHELPRPPIIISATSRNTALVGHSAPLGSRNQELSATNKIPLIPSNSASPLPTPPLPRSFSIPSSGQRAMALHVAKLLETPQNREKAEEVASPPLTPISLANTKPASTTSEVVTRAGQTRGGGGD